MAAARTTEESGTAELRDSDWDLQYRGERRNITLSSQEEVTMLESCAYTMTKRNIASHKLGGNMDIGEVVPLATMTSEERKEKYKFTWLQGDTDVAPANH